MAATSTISVEEYLKTSYEPDAEYVDGVIEERNVGEEEHSLWQAALVGYFWPRAREWGVRVRPELRTRTSERRYRVPDVALLDVNAPRDSIALVPPIAAFEILSSEDRLSRLLVRLADFESMGVEALYVVDPADNSVLRYKAGKLEAVSEITFRGQTVPVAELVVSLW